MTLSEFESVLRRNLGFDVEVNPTESEPSGFIVHIDGFGPLAYVMLLEAEAIEKIELIVSEALVKQRAVTLH